MSARRLRVALLGAAGTIAPAITRDLAESDEVSELLLLDLDAGRAETVADAHGGGKARARAADARRGLANVLAGFDLLINSASYRVNQDAMRACLEAGCHYVDLGGLYWMTGRQLELHDEFEGAGLLALLGMGSSPGKTNVMAARAVRQLGERPNALRVSAAGRDLDPPDGLSVPYALQTLLDELTMPPVVVRDGEATELEPLSPGGRVAFPEPIGEAETIHTLHSEIRTFPGSFGCREVGFRLSLAPALLERLRALAGAPDHEVARAARGALPPSPRTVSAHLVEAAADGRMVRVAAVTHPHEAWGLGGGIVSTASPAAAAVRLIARGRIRATGVLPPEACVEPDDLFPELERRGCVFTIDHREAATA
jgi:lysine 6-dehydrogenase